MADLADWTLALKNLLLPQFCRQCGARLLTEENNFFCPTCWEMSPAIERPFCTGCGRPHPPTVGFGTRSNFPCAACRERPNRYLRRVYGAMRYDGAVEEAIKLFKFNGRERLAGPLGALLTDFAERELECDRYDALVPVPLHKVRQRARGYNQSEVLAREALAAFPAARLDTSLARIRPTRTQSKLQGKARQSNVRGAFAVEGDSLSGAHVLLVDDVVTSGGTITECGRALTRAGAASVDVLAVALATPPDVALDD